MLIKIIAMIWIATSLVFLINPNMLKRRFQKKSYKIVRRYLFVMIMFFAGMLIAAGFQAHGIASKVVIILGIAGIFKGFFFLKAKAAEKLIDIFVKQPVYIFRVYAAAQLAIGIVIFTLH